MSNVSWSSAARVSKVRTQYWLAKGFQGLGNKRAHGAEDKPGEKVRITKARIVEVEEI